MKRVLFISQSALSHNLMEAILPLVPFKVKLTCSEGIKEANLLAEKGKLFHLILVDQNALALLKNGEAELEKLLASPLTKESGKALIHSANANLKKEFLRAKGFEAFYCKPFSTEKLAEIIIQGTKK